MRRINIFVVGIVFFVLIVFVNFYNYLKFADFWYQGDEPRHAMNGVLFLELAERLLSGKLPLRNILLYIQDFYTHYPAVSFI